MEEMKHEVEKRKEKIDNEIELAKKMLDQVLVSVQKTELENTLLKTLLIKNNRFIKKLYILFTILAVAQSLLLGFYIVK